MVKVIFFMTIYYLLPPLELERDPPLLDDLEPPPLLLEREGEELDLDGEEYDLLPPEDLLGEE